MYNELKMIILEIRESLINKISEHPTVTIQHLPFEPKQFRTAFELADLYKNGKKLKPEYKEMILSLKDLTENYQTSEHLKCILKFLAPRMDYLIKISKKILDSSTYKFEVDMYNDIVEFLFRNNTGLAHKEAKSIKVNNIPYEDILQYAYAGLLTGIRRYNWTSGYKLSTFVTYWIRESIYKAVNDNFGITYSSKVKSAYKEILKFSRQSGLSLHDITVDIISQQQPDLIKKYSEDIIQDALNINWIYSIDYSETVEDDDSRNLILDAYSIQQHENYDKNITIKEVLTKIEEILEPDEFTILTDYLSLDVYVDKELEPISYHYTDVQKILKKIRSNERVCNYLKEVLV